MASDFIAGEKPTLEHLPPELKANAPAMAAKSRNQLVIIDKDNFVFFKIKDEKSFQFGDSGGEPVAILVDRPDHNPLGIALGRMNKDKTEITIGGIKYNDSNEKRYSWPEEILPGHKHIVVSLSSDKKFSQADIEKIDQFVAAVTSEHKAKQSSLEIDAPKLTVSDVGPAGQQSNGLARIAKFRQI